MKMLQKPALALFHAALRPGALRVPAAASGAALLFCLAWLATVLPVLAHAVPTLWLWGALSGVCMLATAAACPAPAASRSLLGCAALIGIAGLCDFLLLSPVFLLSQCRPPADGEFLARAWRHVAEHGQWFPVTNGAMLLHTFLSTHAESDGAGLADLVRQQLLPRLAACLLMVCCMGLAMAALESLAPSVQESLSADGYICAMVAGMCLHHLATRVYLRLARRAL